MLFHRHDYEMEFTRGGEPFQYELVCRCGDKAANMHEAVEKMRRSLVRRYRLVSRLMLLAALVSAVTGAAFLWRPFTG